MLKALLALIMIFTGTISMAQNKQWIRYDGAEGPGKGKHIVFISGDEEYRSEEALPMLARILSNKYGFSCTVLFAVDPQTGMIDAMNQTNIPGLENLATADLMFIFTRFRELPDEQMKHFDAYIKSAKPIVALRTATHAFSYTRNKNSPFAKYDYKSTVKNWEDGFGRTILGETWVNHHGKHGSEGTRALVDGIHQNAKNPVLNGVKDIWCPTDVYTVRKLPVDCEVLVYGQSTSGMTAESPVNLEKSIMPVAWTRNYKSESGKTTRVFTSTMGASIDLVSEDLRRLLVNACFWAVGLEQKIPERADVNVIGEFKPTMFSPKLFKKGVYPADLQ